MRNYESGCFVFGSRHTGEARWFYRERVDDASYLLFVMGTAAELRVNC